MSTEGERDYFKTCNVCKKHIAFGAPYFTCSVSTCNRPRFTFQFCSLDCFSAHAPDHRNAWAEKAKAPSREQFEREQAEQVAAAAATEQRRQARMVGVGAPGPLKDDAPKDVLVVVSKLKAYIKARGDMNTADSVIERLSDELRTLCDEALERARAAGRKTVMDRDFDR